MPPAVLKNLRRDMPLRFARREPACLMRASNSRCRGVCGLGMNSSLDSDCTGMGDGNSDSAPVSFSSSSGVRKLMCGLPEKIILCRTFRWVNCALQQDRMPKRAPKLSAGRGLVEDLVAGSRILAMHGVLDAYGHVSARSDGKPAHFVMSRSLAPALVTAADMMELGPDSEPLPGETRKGFLERYIHGEIYRMRPDVKAIVHSHSPSVIPFGVTQARLRPIYHMAGFLWSGAPVFDIRKVK